MAKEITGYTTPIETQLISLLEEIKKSSLEDEIRQLKNRRNKK